MPPPPLCRHTQSYETPPQQVYQPGQFNFAPYPKISPIKNVGSSPGFLASSGASAAQTPVKSLSRKETKSMSKIWNTPAKLVEVVASSITAYTGIEPDAGQVTDILKSLLEAAVGPLASPFFWFMGLMG